MPCKDCDMPTWIHTGPRYPTQDLKTNWGYEKLVMLTSVVVLFI